MSEVAKSPQFGRPRFRVLVVDDEAYPHTKVVEELGSFAEHVEIVSARTVPEAVSLAESRFFHLAFVDLHVADEPGIGFVRTLSAVAPSCQIAIMTQYLTTDAAEVLQHLNSRVKFQGVIDKIRGPSRWYRPLVTRLEGEWADRFVDLEGLDESVAAISAKRSRIDQILSESGELARLRLSDDEVATEVRYLLAQLFRPIGSATPTARARIRLRPMPRGFSASVVLEASPSVYVEGLTGTVAGNRCVVKIGAKSEILREAERYERVVRYGVMLDHRVELLGLVGGDALAAISYSFVGGNSSVIRSLDDVLADANVTTATKVLDQLFAPGSRNWYSVQAESSCLRDFFAEELSAPLERAFDSMDMWLRSLSRKVPGLRVEERRLLFQDGLSLSLPDRSSLASGGMLSPVPGSLVHGDMHGGNVLLDEAGSRVCLIDFSNAGFGPRMLDFASLQATVRFGHARTLAAQSGWEKSVDGAGARDLARLVTDESRVARLEPAQGDAEWWVLLAEHLNRAIAVNFDNSSPTEMVWTYFAYCMSMFRFQHLEWYRKLRLLAWLSALVEELRRLGEMR